MKHKPVSSGSGMIAKATTKDSRGKGMSGVMPMPNMGKGKCMYAPKLQVLD